MKEKTKKLLTNAAWNSGSFVLISILMLLATPYFVKKFGIEGYGIYILITSLIGYYGLLDLGLGDALIKFIAEYHISSDFNSINKALNSAIVVQSLIGIFASASLILLVNPIIHFLKISESFRDIAEFGISVCSIGFFLTMISSAFSSTVKGLQRFDISSKVDGLVNIFITICMVILLSAGYGLKECLVVNVIMNFITLIVYIIIIKNLIPTWKPELAADLTYIRSFFSFSFYVFLSKLSGIFANYIVRFIVSAFLTPLAVTYYVVPSKLVGALGGFLGGASTSFFPYSSALNSSNDKEGIRTTYLKGSRIFAGIAAPVCFAMILLSKPVLTLWMGPGFAEKSWLILSILAMGSFIGSLSAIPNTIIMGLGNSKLVGQFALIALLLYILLVPSLTRLMGIPGTSLALLGSSVVLILYVIHKTTLFLKVKKSEYFHTVLNPHIYGFIALCILFYFCYFLYPLNLTLALITGIVYFISSTLYLIHIGVIPLKMMLTSFIKSKNPDPGGP